MINKKETVKSKKYMIYAIVVFIMTLLIIFCLSFFNNNRGQKKYIISKNEENIDIIPSKYNDKKSCEKVGFYWSDSKTCYKEKLKMSYKVEHDDDIIFLGDSITDYYDLDKYYNFHIVNSGVSGWTTDDIINNLEEKIYKYNPKKIFLLIGVNDIYKGKQVEEVVENIKTIIKKISEEKPNAKIYIESIYPINNSDNSKINNDILKNRSNSVISLINDELKIYCEENNITYINMYDELIDKNNQLDIDYTKEGLHLSSEGYQKITEILYNYIKE